MSKTTNVGDVQVFLNKFCISTRVWYRSQTIRVRIWSVWKGVLDAVEARHAPAAAEVDVHLWWSRLTRIMLAAAKHLESMSTGDSLRPDNRHHRRCCSLDRPTFHTTACWLHPIRTWLSGLYPDRRAWGWPPDAALIRGRHTSQWTPGPAGSGSSPSARSFVPSGFEGVTQEPHQFSPEEEKENYKFYPDRT